jgi:hypothetical protein
MTSIDLSENSNQYNPKSCVCGWNSLSVIHSRHTDRDCPAPYPLRSNPQPAIATSSTYSRVRLLTADCGLLHYPQSASAIRRDGLT